MPTAARQVHHTYAEYLALEEDSSTRHEYLDGEIYAMAGGTPDHAALAAVVLRLLGARLPRGCRAYTSDLRVHVPASGLSTYPDVTVVCGRSVRADVDPMAVVNPIVLVEVTSPSTEDYDRGLKLGHFQQLATLHDALIVSHREARVTVMCRGAGDIWTTTDHRAGAVFEVPALGCRLAVDDIYADGLEDA